MAVLLTAACGYNPTSKKETGPLVDGAVAQAGAIANGSTGTENVWDWDAAIPADVGRIIGTGGTTGAVTGGKGDAGGVGAGAGGVTGTTGAGGAIVKQDAGPAPDAAPSDAPVNCPAPAAPANGKVDPKSLSVGGQAIYTCDTGYGRPSLESRTCQADGTWSGTNPTCAPVDCGNLENPKNGKVITPSTTYKSEATYSCYPNYGLSAAAKRTCQENGTWSGSAPTCQCEQKMCNGVCVDLKTDVANCGDCGQVCATAEPSIPRCVPTGCLITLVRSTSVTGFALDATHVYWSDGHAHSVNRVPVLGGFSNVIADGQDFPSALVVDASTVYWVRSYKDIQAMPSAGGQPVTLVSGVSPPRRLVTNSTHLYYLDNYGIHRVPLAGGDPTVVVSLNGDTIRTFDLDSSNVYWVKEDSSATGGSVFKIMKQPLEGGESVTLAASKQFRAMAVDATHVYWTEPETSATKGSVWKAPLAGGAATAIASGLDGPDEIVVDGTSVYWIGDFGGHVLKLPVAGGTPTILIANRWLISSLAFDATSLYWVENRDDTGSTMLAVTKLTPR